MKKALVIDDEESAVEILTAVLEMNKFVCDCALNGKEGLYKIEISKYDLIVLDIKMPKMDGVAVLKEIRTSEFNADVPVIIASGRLDEKLKIKLSTEFIGLNYLFPKPIDINDFGELVGNVMGV